MLYLIYFIFALVATWFTVGCLLPLLRLGLLDQPNDRSSHVLPIPRGGGLAFVLIGSIFVGLVGSFLPLICTPLALVGLIDDRRNLPTNIRFGVQIFTSFALLIISPLSTPSLSFFIWIFLLIGATAVINFSNFMDGLDGLLAGCMVVLLSVAAISGMPTLWPLVGSLFGFLLWNWNPAKVFMGDVGSTFLGAVFAGVVLQQPSIKSSLELILVATPLLADASFCVFRRLLAGQPVLQAHRLHLFQRLHQSGWSHVGVSALYIISTFILGAALLVGGAFWLFVFVVVVLFIGIWLEQRIAVPFSIS